MLAVSGANGRLGQRLLRAALHDAPLQPVRALVRSEAAARRLDEALPPGAEVRVMDPGRRDAWTEALQGCRSVVHLVGILRESANSRYEDAHERTCRALAAGAAAAGVHRIVYVSVLGAWSGSDNACLASRGAAEQILLMGRVPATVLRVPMVLGETDPASQAVARRAGRRLNLVLRPDSLEQPVYAGDVVAALLASSRSAGSASKILELAGPESLPRGALLARAAALRGRRTRIVPVPLALGMAAAWLLERLLAAPPVTRAMLGVLDHDDCIDPQPAAAELALALTPLDEMLRRAMAEDQEPPPTTTGDP